MSSSDANQPAPSQPQQESLTGQPAKRPFQFGLGTLLIVVTVVGMAAGLIGSYIQHRLQVEETKSNLRQLAIAAHHHHDVHNAFPAQASVDPSGKPLLSWRVHLLPFIEQKELYDRFHLDEPWDSPHNKPLTKEMPKVFRSLGGASLEKGKTCFLAPVGPHTAFYRPWRRRGWRFQSAIDDRARRGCRIAEIVDGTSYAIMIVEVAPEHAVIWTKPDDWEFDPSKPTDGLVGHRRGGFFTVFCDGAFHFVPATIEAEDARRLFMRDDEQPVDHRKLGLGR